MRVWTSFVVLACLLACGGCGKKKTTDELIGELNPSQGEKERITAARTLPGRTGDPEKVVPALIAALKDKDGDVRRSAAIGLGNFGEKAKEAIPALQAAQRDRDARVQEAAGKALSRIDPERFPYTPKARPARGR
jgi:HEAT repeat protein